jgi:hypothetical protein
MEILCGEREREREKNLWETWDETAWHLHGIRVVFGLKGKTTLFWLKATHMDDGPCICVDFIVIKEVTRYIIYYIAKLERDELDDSKAINNCLCFIFYFINFHAPRIDRNLESPQLLRNYVFPMRIQHPTMG